MKTNLKKQTSRILLLTAISLVFTVSSAMANAIIKGRVLTNSDQSVLYATATLLNPKTMEIVEGDMCDNKGEFIIENVKPGEYILSVRKVGFAKDESKKLVIDSFTNRVEEKKIVLNESVQQLPEVVVIGKRLQNKQAVASNNIVNRKDKNPTSYHVEANDFSSLINQLGNYLKELQSKNVDTPETNENSSFRKEVESFMVNQYKETMHSGLEYISNQKRLKDIFSMKK